MNNRIEIPLSKGKLVYLFLMALVFVALGLWFLLQPEAILKNSPFAFIGKIGIQILGLITVAFFGILPVYMFKKLFDQKAGLIIDENGIIYNGSGINVGLIKWEDILEIKRKQVVLNKFMAIVVKNPEEYINKIDNKAQARIVKANTKNAETPILINNNALKISFSELEKILLTEFEKHKK